MNQPKMVVIGSLNMDLVVTADRMPRIGETIEGSNIHYIPGGKGANQAVGCARLGAEVTMIGSVGQDAFGQQILSQLTNYGIVTERIVQLEGIPTGTATILHTAQDNCIVIVPGANGKTTEASVASNREVIQNADIMLVQLEIPMATVLEALRTARSHGVKTVLNPAPAKPLTDELLSLVDILTPNETEFEALSGKSYASEEELLEGMKAWENKYRQTLIITRGEKGSSYIHNGELQTAAAPSVQVVDTTGAGDCFNAALAYSLAAGGTLNDAVSFAIRAASLSVTKFGAQEGMPTYEEVIRSSLTQY